MPSLLPTFKATLQAAFEAVVPADQEPPETPDPLLRYRWIDTLNEERRNGGHREVMWTEAQRGDPQSRVSRMIEWQISAVLFIHRRPGQTQDAWLEAVAQEVHDLDLAYWRQIQVGWGSPQIHSALLDTVTTETSTSSTKKRAGGAKTTSIVAVVTFPFRVLIREQEI